MVLQSKLNFLEERWQSTIYFLGFKKKEFEFFLGGGGRNFFLPAFRSERVNKSDVI